MSIRQVAAVAGVSPMAMYRHFADKDALIDALMLDGLATWEETVAAVEEDDPIRWLEKVCNAFIEYAISDPHRFDAAFLLPARGARRYPHDFVARRSPGVTMSLERLDEAQRRGVPMRLPSERIMPMLSGLLQGMVSLHRSGRFSSEEDLRILSSTAVRDLLSLVTGSETH